MTIGSWDVERFGSELTQKLVAVLSEARDPARITAAVQEAAAAAEELCGDRPYACAAGCPHCCVLNVAVLLPEAMIIAQWLQQRFTQTELVPLRERLSFHLSWSRWMDDEERIAKGMHCPMLDASGLCFIHPVRPLVCRGVTSLDVASCREAFRPVITDEPPLVMTDLMRKGVYDEAFAALAEAMRLRHLDDRSIDIGAGVTAFLDRPECRELLLSGVKLPRNLWG